MLMARYNGSPDVTFARKGEARPTGTAGAPIPFPVRPQPIGGGHDRGSHAEATADEPQWRVPLGMLIQRSSATPIQASPPAATSTAPAHSVVRLNDDDRAAPATTVDLQVLSRPSTPGGKRGTPAHATVPRRQMTFRLRFEDYRALAELRSATATTFQALLERAALALLHRPVGD